MIDFGLYFSFSVVFFFYIFFLYQIDVLLEQLDHVRKQIIEKEEEVGRLLQEMDHMDDLKAENNQLKVLTAGGDKINVALALNKMYSPDLNFLICAF